MASLFDSDRFNRAMFFPRPDTSAAPAGAADHAVDVGGAALHLRWHAAPDTRAAVLLFHGNGEVVADYDGFAPLFRDAGAELAVVDYRGYGRSTGTPTLRAALADAHAVFAFAAARAGKPLIVMGRSLGSACAAELYGSVAAAGVIFESGFTDLKNLVRRRGMQPPDAFDDDDARVFDPLPKLARGSLPLCVIHGEQDTIIPVADGRRAFESAGAAVKRFVGVAGRGHNDVSFAPAYWDGVRWLIDAA